MVEDHDELIYFFLNESLILYFMWSPNPNQQNEALLYSMKVNLSAIHFEPTRACGWNFLPVLLISNELNSFLTVVDRNKDY